MTTGSHVARRSLVTGGAGFIGSHLVEHLLARGDEVVVVDNYSTGRQTNLASVITSSRLRLLVGAVEDVVPTFAPGEFDEIYHLAAAVGVRLVIERPVETIRTNVLDTVLVLDHAAAAGTPILIASTSEVYGKSAKMPFAEDDDVMYGPTIYSRWSYACSKAIDEYLALAYSRQQQLPVVIARFFNTVGPRQIGRYGMVVPRFVEAAMSGLELQVHGDGQQTRCFCDVRDVVELLPRMMNDRCFGRVFNVGHDQPISINDLARLVIETLKSSSTISLVPYAEAFGEGFDDLRHRQPHLQRIREATGFTPSIPLDQTIRDLAVELRDRNGCRPERANA